MLIHRLNDSQSRVALIGLIPNLPFYGSVAGVSVKVPVTFAPKSGDGVTPLFPNGLPSGYGVQITPSQPCIVSVSNKTNTGFTVMLTPLGDAVSIKDGTIDIAILA